MRKIVVISALLLLSACDHFDEDSKAVSDQTRKDAKQVETNVGNNATRVANNVRDQIKRTGEHVRNWWITPLPSNARQPLPPRYCYRVLQDILCYRAQMPGWEDKLVAYQGDGAAPPTPPTMRLMPLRTDSKSISPEKRIENVKPVFVSIPPEVKEEKGQDQPATTSGTLDPAYDTIQDSVMSPQL